MITIQQEYNQRCLQTIKKTFNLMCEKNVLDNMQQSQRISQQTKSFYHFCSKKLKQIVQRCRLCHICLTTEILLKIMSFLATVTTSIICIVQLGLLKR